MCCNRNSSSQHDLRLCVQPVLLWLCRVTAMLAQPLEGPWAPLVCSTLLNSRPVPHRAVSTVCLYTVHFTAETASGWEERRARPTARLLQLNWLHLRRLLPDSRSGGLRAVNPDVDSNYSPGKLHNQ